MTVEVSETRSGIRLSLHVAPGGHGAASSASRGRTAQALRTLVRAAAARRRPGGVGRHRRLSPDDPESRRREERPLLEVGRIARAHGLRGEVVVTLVTNRPERIAPGASSPAARGRGRLPASSRTPVSAVPGSVPRRVRGRRDRPAADELRGAALLAPAIDDPDELFVHDLVGREVVEQDGTATARWSRCRRTRRATCSCWRTAASCRCGSSSSTRPSPASSSTCRTVCSSDVARAVRASTSSRSSPRSSTATATRASSGGRGATGSSTCACTTCALAPTTPTGQRRRRALRRRSRAWCSRPSRSSRPSSRSTRPGRSTCSSPGGRRFDQAVAASSRAWVAPLTGGPGVLAPLRALRGRRPAHRRPPRRRRALDRATSCSPAASCAGLVVVEATVPSRPGRARQRGLDRRRELHRAACSSTRSTRGRRTSGAGRCPRCCGAATTAGSNAGAGPRRSRRTIERRPDLIDARGGLTADEVRLARRARLSSSAHATGTGLNRRTRSATSLRAGRLPDRLEERDLS